MLVREEVIEIGRHAFLRRFHIAVQAQYRVQAAGVFVDAVQPFRINDVLRRLRHAAGVEFISHQQVLGRRLAPGDLMRQVGVQFLDALQVNLCIGRTLLRQPQFSHDAIGVDGVGQFLQNIEGGLGGIHALAIQPKRARAQQLQVDSLGVARQSPVQPFQRLGQQVAANTLLRQRAGGQLQAVDFFAAMLPIKRANQADGGRVIRLLIQRALGMPNRSLVCFQVLISLSEPQMRREVLRHGAQQATQHISRFRPAFGRDKRASQLLIGAQVFGIGLEDMARVRDDFVVFFLRRQPGQVVLVGAQADFRHLGPVCSALWANQ